MKKNNELKNVIKNTKVVDLHQDDLSNISTYKLVDELKKREGVNFFEIAPYEEKYLIKKWSSNCASDCGKRIDEYGEEGGAIILEVID